MSLQYRTVYLAGPIDNCTWDEKWTWRFNAEILLKPIVCFNPCVREFNWDVLDENTAKEVVTLDKAEIEASDCVLAWYNPPAAGSMMSGTTMELIYAFERGKLVIVVTNMKTVSPWVMYHSHRLFNDLEMATDFIKNFYDK